VPLAMHVANRKRSIQDRPAFGDIEVLFLSFMASSSKTFFFFFFFFQPTQRVLPVVAA
jgi:hypothetical protein